MIRQTNTTLSPQAFLCSTVCSVLIACLLYYACFSYACGRYIKAEWWLKDIFEYKQVLNTVLPSPRIIIAGGSNSLFGIDSEVLHDLTGYPVYNMSSHAGLDISFHYYQIKQYMREGDIVVIPFEYNYYYSNNPYTDWFVNNMIAWGKEDYLDRLNIIDRIQFIFHVPKQKIYSMLTSDEKPPFTNKDVVISSIANTLFQGWHGYTFKSMNKNGEILVEAGPALPAAKLDKGIRYVKDAPLSPHFIRYFRKITSLVQERRGRLVLAWPPSIRNRLFDLSTDKHRQSALRLREDLQRENIEISCDPEPFNLDVRYFFNTEYHLNKHGARIRSEHLGRCLREILGPNDNSIPGGTTS